MLDLGSRPSSTVAQQTCSQLRPRSSRCLTSCGFSVNPASTAFQSNALTSGSMEVLDTIFVGLYTTAASPAPRIPRAGPAPKRPACPQHRLLLISRKVVCDDWLTEEVTVGVGGPDRDRTGDLVNAIHARSQLRHWPTLVCGRTLIVPRWHRQSKPVGRGPAHPSRIAALTRRRASPAR